MRFIAEVSEPTKKFWQSEQKVNTEMRNSIRAQSYYFLHRARIRCRGCQTDPSPRPVAS